MTDSNVKAAFTKEAATAGASAHTTYGRENNTDAENKGKSSC